MTDNNKIQANSIGDNTIQANLTEQEIWKRMPEFDNEYEVSNLGRFRSVDRTIIRKGSKAHIKGKIIKGQQDAQGYVAMTIKNKQEKAHRLVAKYFVENPLNKKEVNHKNGIKNDNRASNLEWCSHEENMKHLYTKMPFEHKNTKQKRLERDNLIKKLSSFISCSTIEEVKDCWVSSKNLLNMLNVKIEYVEVPKFYSEYVVLQSDSLAKNEGVEINAELEAENTKLKTENKWYSEQLNEAVKEIGQLKEKNEYLQRILNTTNDINKIILKKLVSLKNLLKECREEIASVDWDSPLNERNQIELLAKIDQALANNKIKTNTIACNKIQENK